MVQPSRPAQTRQRSVDQRLVRRDRDRGYRLDPGLCQHLAHPVGVERAVGKELTACKPLEQRRRAAQIVGLPGQQTEVDQVTESIG